MEDNIRKYINLKWVLCIIFNGNIVKQCEKNIEIKNKFLSVEMLSYLKQILNGEFSYKCFDEQKLSNIALAMQHFITKYGSEVKPEVIEYCHQILELTKHPKGKSLKKFYDEQYLIRNQMPCKKVTTEIEQDIDRQIALDLHYLVRLAKLDTSEQMPLHDIQFIKSVNIFIKECPEIVCEDDMHHYVEYIITANQYSSEYTQNEEFRRLNDSLLDYYEGIRKNANEINEQILNQSVFSLIFDENFALALSKLKVLPGKQDFFAQEQFDILCEFIIKNKETCYFNKRKMDNMRNLLFAFLDEVPNLNMKYSLNELKIALNTYEDEEFKKKNLAFYKEMGKEYLFPMQQFDDTYISEFKRLIDILINNTSSLVLDIVNDEVDIDECSKNQYLPGYVNYIIKNYPLIRENPIYMQKIQNILAANDLWLGLEQKYQAQIQNYKVQKKVKKLCK